MAGIYIHIPFCKQKCHYCSFHFSTTYGRYRDEMINALQSQIKLESPFIKEPISSIYFGGGTPSLLDATELRILIDTCKSHYKMAEEVEVTLEANPDDLNSLVISNWLETGINRLSLGIQSFHEHNLTSMNRAHNANQASNSIQLIKSGGFDNYSVDLMFALPDLTNAQWEHNLRTVIENEVPHISCYNLTIEESTALKNWIDKEKMAPLSEESSVKQFEIAMDKLKLAGYEQYEISNYCRPGKRSKHNSSYWENKNYIGIGPSAHSYIDGMRSYVVSNNKQYIEKLRQVGSVRTNELLSRENQFNEYIMTRLRTKEGINLTDLNHRFDTYIDKIQDQIDHHLEKGNLVSDGNLLQLTHQGKFTADLISMDLFI